MECLYGNKKRRLEALSVPSNRPLLEWCDRALGAKYKEIASFYMKDKSCALNNSKP